MKSIIRLISSNYSVSFIYVILAFISLVLSSPPCGLYGAPPCQFLPAPPGHTPSCARPGKTYCEHIDNYPTYLIKHLVHKWGHEAKNLLVDETWDDFAALAWHETPVFYDPAYIFPHRHHFGGNANNNGEFPGYRYETPSGGGGSATGSHSKYGEETFLTITKQQHPTEPPTSAGQRLNLNKNQGNSKVTPNNPTLWLKRIARNLNYNTATSEASVLSANVTAAPDTFSTQKSIKSTATSRDISINMDLLDIVGVEKGASTRQKRQSQGRSSLCQTRAEFVTPQAALNSKGNWMFVVNEANTARQMVKAELCASNTCSNLCQLPLGYNSRCEQKFVQKRLIALQANGQSLYADTFWFPSCCVCTIASN